MMHQRTMARAALPTIGIGTAAALVVQTLPSVAVRDALADRFHGHSQPTAVSR